MPCRAPKISKILYRKQTWTDRDEENRTSVNLIPFIGLLASNCVTVAGLCDRIMFGKPSALSQLASSFPDSTSLAGTSLHLLVLIMSASVLICLPFSYPSPQCDWHLSRARELHLHIFSSASPRLVLFLKYHTQ
jgi:hypothetical protein